MRGVRSAVCLAANLGDEAFYAGGAIDELVRGGARVTVVALAPRLTPLPVLGPLALAASDRRAIAGMSARVLGVARVEVLDMSDPPLSPAERVHLQMRLAAVLREERPGLVLSHGPGLTTDAVDRRAAASLANAAIAVATNGLVPQRDHTEVWEVAERWLFAPSYLSAAGPRRLAALFGDDPGWSLTWLARDTSELVPRKWDALRCYIDRAPESPPARFRPYLASERYVRARRRGIFSMVAG